MGQGPTLHGYDRIEPCAGIVERGFDFFYQLTELGFTLRIELPAGIQPYGIDGILGGVLAHSAIMTILSEGYQQAKNVTD